MKAAFRAILVLRFRISARESSGQRTEKPTLHCREWVAITGKLPAVAAGAEPPRSG